jgi:uncharacterized protein (DUF58 family)
VFVSVRAAIVLAALSAGAIAFPGSPGIALLLLDGALAAAIIGDVLRAPDPARIPRERRHPEVVSTGREVEIALHVMNPARRRVRAEVRDGTVPSLRADPTRWTGVLHPGTGVIRTTLRPERRGRFALGPVTVRTLGPLGLAGRQRTIDLRTELKVYPSLRGRERVEGRLRRSRLLEAGTRSARVRGGGLEFDSLREYHPDDEFRRINWPATARAGKAISNVYREERNQQVLLLLDAGRTMAGTVGGVPRFEHALDAAVAVASLAVQIGDRVGAFAFERRLVASVPPRADDDHPRRIVDAMFAVEPAVAASDYLGAVEAVLGRYRRRALLVLFTDLADEAAADPLLNAIPALARRHLVLVAEVTDPEVARMARAFARTAPDAFLKAAAAGDELRRDRAARRLVRLGAEVVDRPPGELAPGLADAYLRAKAYGRL